MAEAHSIWSKVLTIRTPLGFLGVFAWLVVFGGCFVCLFDLLVRLVWFVGWLVGFHCLVFFCFLSGWTYT